MSKISDHMQIKTNMSHLSQEAPASCKDVNYDLKGMDISSTFRVNCDSQNMEHGWFREQFPYHNGDQDAKPQ